MKYTIVFQSKMDIFSQCDRDPCISIRPAGLTLGTTVLHLFFFGSYKASTPVKRCLWMDHAGTNGVTGACGCESR